jgi:4-amino-4-deoxy-L-arabinose transferase-like glycosyltransferase
MSFTARLSPARVSAAAAVAFPRRALFALLVIYIAAGLVGRDPWGSEDAAAFGVMWAMANGTGADWVLPVATGEWNAEEGPLPFWVGALFVKLFGGWLGAPLAARLTTVLWFALTTTALWYGTYALARRDAAQPVSFAFGGEASPKDYGRMLADIAVLLLLGTVGLALRMHELSAESAALAWTAVALFGIAWSLDRPRAGAVIAGVAIGAAALSRGPWLGLWLAASAAVALWLIHPAAARLRTLAPCLAAAALVAALWPLASLGAPAADRAAFWQAYGQWVARSAALPALTDLVWLPKNGAWYAWPLWPLVFWALYSWRHLLRTAHIAVPLVMACALLLAGMTTQPVNDSFMVPLVAPLVVLATFGAASLRRSLDDLIDWFAMATFSLFAIAAWAYFLAWQTGVPRPMAGSVQRLIPGFNDAPGLLVLVLALAATALWGVLILWRLSKRPPMLWTGPLLAACGLTMLWLLLTTLFLAAVNYNRTYRPLAEQLGTEVRRQQAQGLAHACVQPLRLSAGQRAVFAYFGKVDFGHPARPQDCQLLLQRDSRRSALDDDLPAGDWRPVWSGTWPARPDEVIRLHRLAGG